MNVLNSMINYYVQKNNLGEGGKGWIDKNKYNLKVNTNQH